MFNTIISCHEYKGKKLKKWFAGLTFLNFITISVKYCRYRVPFIQTFLPNGGVTYIFSHSPMDGTRTKTAAMRSPVTVLYIMKFVILSARMS